MLNEMIQKHQRLGYYRVGNKSFFNKVEAMMCATKSGEQIGWVFNDEKFISVDWKTPVLESLNSLYRKRAQQLRSKYDYVSLFFSGGVDSTNVLHAFIDNDILLDEIIMFRPKTIESLANNIDTSSANVFSEIKYAAIPHLNKYLTDSRTVVRFIDIDHSAESFLNDSIATTQFSKSINLLLGNTVGKIGMCLNDSIWQNLSERGKSICHIQGTDKPMIKRSPVDGYYFQFTDTMTWVFEPGFQTDKTEMMMNNHFHELFYWSPDMPELVVKQCQVVKKRCEEDLIFRILFSNSDLVNRKYLTGINQLIYPQHVNAIRGLFCTEKPSYSINDSSGSWVHKYLNTAACGVYVDLTTNIRNQSAQEMFAGVNSNYFDDKPTPNLKQSNKFFKSRKYIL